MPSWRIYWGTLKKTFFTGDKDVSLTKTLLTPILLWD